MLINSSQTVLKDANNCWKYLEQKLSALLNPWRTLLDTVDFLSKKQTNKESPQQFCYSKNLWEKHSKCSYHEIFINQVFKIYQLDKNTVIIIITSDFNNFGYFFFLLFFFSFLFPVLNSYVCCETPEVVITVPPKSQCRFVCICLVNLKILT